MDELPSPDQISDKSTAHKPGQVSYLERIRSLTRILIGGIVLGSEQLFTQLQSWEEVASTKDPHDQTPGFSVVDQPKADSRSPHVTSIPPESGAQNSVAQIRHAAIGLVFEAQDHLQYNLRTLRRAEKAVYRLARPITAPVQTSRLLAPARQGFSNLIDRGQLEVDRWVARGQNEEAHSRQLADIAYDDTVNDFINYLTANPELRELVQTQGTGLAYEVVEEVRERTVSADTFLESLARSVLRLRPRTKIPAPPTEIRLRAFSIHSQQFKKSRKA